MPFIDQNYPVGARVVIRDAEWRVTSVDSVKQGGSMLTCEGVSGVVRGKTAKFFTIYEDEIRILQPEETDLVRDDTPGYAKSRLYLESLFRSSPRTESDRIYIANKAAMDPMPYQFNPAAQALAQPRVRILIADAVGIGKTLEAGILASELIARGRGKRILVVATKAMLPQFQQEFWNRFTIPLVRLDSAGLQRIRDRIPANQNPFLYYDRSIISIDTLKQDQEYRAYLEKAFWDIIIIDEAHNVAQRGTSSLRSKLAKLLATRSDSMIMLTATPHDGRSESFASLMNMLDPTAIANPRDYRLEDFAGKGLVIRRFKSNIRKQVEKEFPDREIEVVRTRATPAEDAVYSRLAGLTFRTLDNLKASGAHLFATTLKKALFSSPAACDAVIRHRLEKLVKRTDREGVPEDIEKLEELQELVRRIAPDCFAKLQVLKDMLSGGAHSIGWNRRDPEDRLVIFTESVETLDFLARELPPLLQLKPKEVISLKGSMKDSDIAERIDEFNRRESPARLLIASDVASEGLNLHHFSHRMVHFDVPWSLLTFQQRNGRIDRYGQTKKPQIRYLQTTASGEQAALDERILEKLIEKDEQAQKNLSDPAEFSLSAEEQEERTAVRIEGRDPDEGAEPADDWSELDDWGEESEDAGAATLIAPVMEPEEYEERLAKLPSLFPDDKAYALASLAALSASEGWKKQALELVRGEAGAPDRIFLTAPKDLRARLQHFLPDALPKDWRFDLTADPKLVEREMTRVRQTEEAWPAIQLLWPQHPVFEWLVDRGVSLFGRNSAPLIASENLMPGERWALLQGGYPNRRGYIPVHRWIAVHDDGAALEAADLKDLIRAVKLNDSISNDGGETAAEWCDRQSAKGAEIRRFIEKAVGSAKGVLANEKARFDAAARSVQERELEELGRLRRKHEVQMELDFQNVLETMKKKRLENRRAELDRVFESAKNYIRNNTETEDEPYIQLAAVFVSSKE